MMRLHFPRAVQLERLQRDGWRVVTFKRCAMVAAWHEMAGKWFAKVWFGNADKAAWYYTFRSRAVMEAEIAGGEKSRIASEAAKASYRAKAQAGKCITVADVYAKAAKDGYVSAPDVAICLRAALKREFPGVKFSVRSEHSIRVSWTDGPMGRDVDRVAQCYSGEGFDGMIDLRHSIDRWLAPDGSMALAHDSGTEGSRGSVPEAIGSAHRPDAVLVSLGSSFVFTSRALSPAVKRAACVAVCQRRGIPMPALETDLELERFINQTRDGGDYLSLRSFTASQPERTNER